MPKPKRSARQLTAPAPFSSKGRSTVAVPYSTRSIQHGDILPAGRDSSKGCSPGRVGQLDLVFLRRTKAGKGGVAGPALRFCMAPGRGRVMPVKTVKEAVALARRYRDCVGGDRRSQKACLLELPGGKAAPFGGVGSLRLGGTMVRGKRLPGFLRRRG